MAPTHRPPQVSAVPPARVRAWVKRLDARRRSLAEEIEEDVAPLRGLSRDERGRILESVCRDAMAILEARPDFARAREWSEPRSPEALATWLRLVREYRAARGRH